MAEGLLHDIRHRRQGIELGDHGLAERTQAVDVPQHFKVNRGLSS